MYKAEQVDGDKDRLRVLLHEAKAYVVASILPNYFENFGMKWNAKPIHAEIMAIGTPAEIDSSQLGWQQLHRDSYYADPLSILCAVSSGYYFDMQLEDQSGNAMRVRQKLDTAEMSVIRGNLPHAGGPTTAYRLHLTAKFHDDPVSHFLPLHIVLFIKFMQPT